MLDFVLDLCWVCDGLCWIRVVFVLDCVGFVLDLCWMCVGSCWMCVGFVLDCV